MSPFSALMNWSKFANETFRRFRYRLLSCRCRPVVCRFRVRRRRTCPGRVGRSRWQMPKTLKCAGRSANRCDAGSHGWIGNPIPRHGFWPTFRLRFESPDRRSQVSEFQRRRFGPFHRTDRADQPVRQKIAGNTGPGPSSDYARCRIRAFSEIGRSLWRGCRSDEARLWRRTRRRCACSGAMPGCWSG